MAKTVLITGASKGIGASTAKLFAQNGYNVILNYYHSETEISCLCEELTEYGVQICKVKANVGDRQQVEQMINEIYEKFSHIDVLVNNAGIAQQELFLDTTLEKWTELFNVNVNGVFSCCQCVLPDMIREKKGKIINISSVWGITGASCEVAYSTTKAAVIGFTKSLAKEVGPCNIQVNCIAPGVINTDMNADLDQPTMDELILQTPLGRIGEADDIAQLILFLASDSGNFITGQVISPNGGFLI